MAKSILSTIHKKIEDMSEKYPFIFLDFLSDHLSDNKREWFISLLPKKDRDNLPFQEIVLRLFAIIVQKRKGWDQILQSILKSNALYVEHMGYHKLSQGELKEEFAKDMSPASAGEGVTPQMMIMYLIYKRKFNNPLMSFAIREYELYDAKIREKEKQAKEVFNLDIPKEIKGTIFEEELKACLRETSLNFPKDEKYFEDLAQKNNLKYFPKEKKLVIPRGLAFFIFNKIKDIYLDQIALNKTYRLLLKALHDVNSYADKVRKIHDKFTETLSENLELKRKIRLIRQKLLSYEEKEKTLKQMLKSERNQDKDNIIKNLQKQLNFTYSRIEELEKRIDELEEAKEINREITENIEIQEKGLKEKSLMFEEGSLIVVSGGWWNSQNKEEVETFFESQGCVVEFVPAEDTIKKQDLITNADLVIFDTSRHSHKYYYKVKQVNRNIVFINKSNIQEIKKML